MDRALVSGTRCAGSTPARGKDLIMKQEFLDILACPTSKEPLQLVSSDQLKDINDTLSSRKYEDGSSIEITVVHEALYALDSKKMYIINEGIPILMPNKAIDCSDIL